MGFWDDFPGFAGFIYLIIFIILGLLLFYMKTAYHISWSTIGILIQIRLNLWIN